MLALCLRIEADKTVISCKPEISPLILHHLIDSITWKTFRHIIAGEVIRLRIITAEALTQGHKPQTFSAVFIDTDHLIVRERSRVFFIRQVIFPLLTSDIIAKDSIGESSKPEIAVEILQYIISEHALQFSNACKVVRRAVVFQQTGRCTDPDIACSGFANGKSIISGHRVLSFTSGIMLHLPGMQIHPV